MARTLLALGVILACSRSGYPAEKTTLKDIMTYMGQCQQEFRIDSTEIMDAIQKKKLPETENGKCFVACMMKKFGAMEDGKFNVKRIYELNKQRFNDADNLAKANKITKKCTAVQVQDGNECALAYEAMKCGMDNAMQMNLQVPMR